MTSFTSADESRYTTVLPLSRPRARQDGTGAGTAGHGGQGRAEVEQIARRWDYATAAHEALDMAGAAQGDQQGDWATARGDLQGPPRLDVAEVLARWRSSRTPIDFMVLHCGTRATPHDFHRCRPDLRRRGQELQFTLSLTTPSGPPVRRSS